MALSSEHSSFSFMQCFLFCCSLELDCVMDGRKKARVVFSEYTRVRQRTHYSKKTREHFTDIRKAFFDRYLPEFETSDNDRFIL